MSKKDKLLGTAILMFSVSLFVVYGYLLFFTDYWILLSKITLFLIVAVVFGILAWIGISMIEASNKMPLEQIKSEIEKEIFGGEEE